MPNVEPHGPSKMQSTNNAEFAREWFTRQLRRGVNERFSEDMLVTPALAVVMLENNKGNRKFSVVQVAQHVDRLKNGKFILTHQGIAFSKDGILIDGQHRLMAIAKANVAGLVGITFGCNKDEFRAVDQGRKRTGGDIIFIDKMTYPKIRASLCRFLLIIENIKIRPTAQDAAEIALEFGSSLDKACRVGSELKTISPASSIALAVYWIEKRSKHSSKLDDFLSGLRTGENINGAKLRLREVLLHNEHLSGKGGDVNVERAGIVIFAWNAWISRRTRFDTRWPQRTKLPDPV